MNVLCENCKVIREFSGEPLKCEVCGWEWNGASQSEVEEGTHSNRDVPAVESAAVWTGEESIGRGNLLRTAVWAIVIVCAVILAAHFGARTLSLMPGKHAEAPSQYTIALKYHLTMEQVIMDPKPQGCDFSDSPMGDKHCHFEQSENVVRECLTPNCPVKRVYVSWHKVRD